MNNWGIFFVVLGAIIVISILSGTLITNKALNLQAQGSWFNSNDEDVDTNDVGV